MQKIGNRFMIFFIILIVTVTMSATWIPMNGISKTRSELQKSTLNGLQLENATQIADICTEEWDTYGIWPSVAIAQAFIESGIGIASNMFGCIGHAGRGVCSATYGYLGVLQNQYFKGRANFAPNPDAQIALILKGGNYCAGEYPYGHYHNLVNSSIDRYGLSYFDRIIKHKIRAKRAAKRRKRLQRKPFRIIFSDDVPEGCCCVDRKYVRNGSTIIYPGGIVEVTSTKRNLQNTIIIGRRHIPILESWRKTICPNWMDKIQPLIHVEVIENAKG